MGAPLPLPDVSELQIPPLSEMAPEMAPPAPEPSPPQSTLLAVATPRPVKAPSRGASSSKSRTPRATEKPRSVTTEIAPPGAREDVAPQPAGSGTDKGRDALLRELRDEVLDLRTVLTGVRKGELSLQDFAEYIGRTRQEIGALLKDIHGAGAIRHLGNLWDQMCASPLMQNPAGPFEVQAQLHLLDLLEAQCKKLVFEVGVLTIPERVNEWLQASRPGYYVPFNAVFEDELPDRDDRSRMLNYLTWAPNALKGGLVDAEAGLIYRYSEDAARRRLTFLGLVGAFLAVTGIIPLACYVPIPSWPLSPPDLAHMLMAWGAILVGVVVHIGVSTAKRAQADGGRPPIIAVGDVFLLIDARFGHILLKLLMALVGFFGMVFTVGPASAAPLNMFLVGYSLDSVVEMFGASLEQRAGVQLTALKQQLGVQSTR
jgi:hypothetical protein